jgi:DNA mismatch repair protein MutH
MNRDFVEMLSALCEAKAEFLVIGAHALAVHGRPRATGDLDLWIRPTSENASRVWAALGKFGAPLGELKQDDLQTSDLVYQIGIPPKRIDVLTSISGVTFEDAWVHRVLTRIGDLTVPVLGKAELIRNKRAVGRPRDLLDVSELEGS